MTYWVYILASRKHGTLYVGVTNSLERRIPEHRAKRHRGFTETYGVDRLVWFRGYGEVTEAIGFERRLKRWRRDWKVVLIEEDNLHWDCLYVQSVAPQPSTLAFMGPG
jgi:putative endonuclease